MAAVVPFASCYGNAQPLHLFGKGGRLLMYRGPHCAPRPRLACHAPKLTLRQICRMLRVMKQVRNREAAAAAASRKQGSMSPAPASPGSRSDRKCLLGSSRYKRNIKRVG
ncbi:hypothetical protein JOB18_048562 [Solea senegalensis]|uniref:Uncharacterized protein n=1 Tax=Solea senegalensis TaxID=28829 RepID=A0AAV6T261_SOLSE|nr:hypothetical protein JOB18_048562 [Solea senegalensis]